MPWAANGFAQKNALGERTSVVRAFCADREPVWLDVNEKHHLSERVTGDHLTCANTACLDPFFEVGTSQLVGVFAHFIPSRRFCARSRWATNAGATFVSRSLSWAFWVAGRRVFVTASMTALWKSTSCWRKARSNALPFAARSDLIAETCAFANAK